MLQPGDRVSVRAWGAVDSEQMGVIDPARNLFLPNIGPIRVAGTRVGDLQAVVEGEIRKVYTSQVQVYATVLSTQRSFTRASFAAPACMSASLTLL